MIFAPPHHSDPVRHSLYEGLTQWASHARQRMLAALAATSLLIGSAVVVLDRRRAPVAGLMLIMATVACWGLLEQRAHVPHTTVVRVAQGLLVLLGTLGAVVAGLGLLFWVMGPAPVL